ncbi:lipopolysaccharide heptosyltransferase family protein [Rhodanobacter denitrificans]|uniref:Lipopolysaccharide heptosyltransferase family protein n=1 Tax=Rhodanobacter denitrificans TaxID=666685 RepID=A0A368KEK2_9GAMM|nr:lipopolysaccharide heptosyltransferase family protein [Rhodanobacter denitrificans]
MVPSALLPQDAPAPPRIASRWRDVFRRRVLSLFLGRLFAAVERQLCEPGQLPARGIHRILICRPNHRLGNAILVSPLLAEVEALYPGAEIDLVVGGEAASHLFANRFQVRRIFSLPRKIARHLWRTRGLLRELRRNSYDLAIDSSQGSQSGRLLLLMVKARFKLGFPDPETKPGSAWHGLPCPDHLAQRGVFLLRAARGQEQGRPYPPLNLDLSDGEKQQARRALANILGTSPLLPAGRTIVGIFANATGAKCYGEDWWQRFVGALMEQRPDVLLVDVLAEHGRSQLGGDFAPYYTRDLRRLASMVANMDGFISADCGVMHLAAASGTPTLGLFSVTAPSKYAPYGGLNGAIDTHGMSAAEVAGMAADWLGGVVPAAQPQPAVPSMRDGAAFPFRG